MPDGGTGHTVGVQALFEVNSASLGPGALDALEDVLANAAAARIVVRRHSDATLAPGDPGFDDRLSCRASRRGRRALRTRTCPLTSRSTCRGRSARTRRARHRADPAPGPPRRDHRLRGLSGPDIRREQPRWGTGPNNAHDGLGDRKLLDALDWLADRRRRRPVAAADARSPRGSASSAGLAGATDPDHLGRHWAVFAVHGRAGWPYHGTLAVELALREPDSASCRAPARRGFADTTGAATGEVAAPGTWFVIEWC